MTLQKARSLCRRAFQVLYNPISPSPTCFPAARIFHTLCGSIHDIYIMVCKHPNSISFLHSSFSFFSFNGHTHGIHHTPTRDWIWAVAMPDPLTQYTGLGIEPAPQQWPKPLQSGVLSHCATAGTPQTVLIKNQQFPISPSTNPSHGLRPQCNNASLRCFVLLLLS